MSVLQAVVCVLIVHALMLGMQGLSIKLQKTDMTIKGTFTVLASVMFFLAAIVSMKPKSSLASPQQTAWWLLGIGFVDLIIFAALQFKALRSRTSTTK